MKSKLSKQLEAHDRAAEKALRSGKSPREATISGLCAEFEFLTGKKF